MGHAVVVLDWILEYTVNEGYAPPPNLSAMFDLRIFRRLPIKT